MNFFERQDQSHRNTKLLVFLFATATILTAIAIHVVVAFVWTVMSANNRSQENDSVHSEVTFTEMLGNPVLILGDMFFVMLVIGGGSLFKVSQLSALNGSGIATSMGGELIQPNTTDYQQRRVLNIVEEMALASGVRIPEVYIMPNEPSINAFAAGFTPNSSVIGVTQGTLDYLTRDELQGVIGHEFSHILNGDTKINLRLMGVLFGLEMLVLLGIILFRNSIYFVHSGGSNSNNKGAGAGIALAMMLFGLAFAIIGSIGMFFSNMIRAAVSRQREYLADASAVQFTRNPDGIAGALKKIGCSNVGSVVTNSNSVEASHMFFGNIFRAGFFSSMMDSHPDLTDRIKTIDPTFEGTYSKSLEKVGLPNNGSTCGNKSDSSERLEEVLRKTMPMDSVMGGKNGGGGGIGGMIVGAGVILSEDQSTQHSASQLADRLVQSVGQTQRANLEIASALLAVVPTEVSALVRQPEKVCEVVYSLLLDKELTIRQKQLQYLSQVLSPTQMETIHRSSLLIEKLPATTKVPIIELAYPTLKQFSVDQYRRFREIVIEIFQCDGKVDLFEYTMQEFLLRELDHHLGLRKKTAPKYRTVNEVCEALQGTMSYLAHAGNDDLTAVVSAYTSGVAPFHLNLPLLDKSACTPLVFSKGLGQLILTVPSLQQELLHAFYRCIADDGVITETEGELIRAISAALDCPMPGWTYRDSV